MKPTLYCFRKYGCLPPDEGGLMQCRGNLVPHLNPTSIACCSDEDFCNKKLIVDYKVVPDTPETDTIFPYASTATTVALLITFAFCIVMLIFIVTCVYLRLVEDGCF